MASPPSHLHKSTASEALSERRACICMCLYVKSEGCVCERRARKSVMCEWEVREERKRQRGV